MPQRCFTVKLQKCLNHQWFINFTWLSIDMGWVDNDGIMLSRCCTFSSDHNLCVCSFIHPSIHPHMASYMDPETLSELFVIDKSLMSGRTDKWRGSTSSDSDTFEVIMRGDRLLTHRLCPVCWLHGFWVSSAQTSVCVRTDSIFRSVFTGLDPSRHILLTAGSDTYWLKWVPW